MAVLFSDNFNRSNGALGGNWATISGSPAVSSNHMTASGASVGLAINPAATGYPDQAVQATMLYGSTATYYGYLVARSDATFANAYYINCYISGAGGNPYVDLYKRVNSQTVRLATVWFTPDNTTSHTFRLECVGTRLRVYIDDVLWLDFNDASISGGDYVGCASYGSGCWWDDFYTYDAYAAGLSVYPSEVQEDSVDNNLTLWGEGTNWTPGTPGSPTFTCLLGSITYQEILTATTAVILYTAPSYVSSDVIADPDSGATAKVAIGYAPAGPGQFTEQAVADLTQLASTAREIPAIPGDTPFEQLLNFSALWAPENAPDLEDWGLEVNAIWSRVHTELPEPYTLAEHAARADTFAEAAQTAADAAQASAEAAQTAAESADAQLTALTTGTPNTISGLNDSIKGIGDYSNTALMNAINALSEPDLSAVTDLINAMTGSGTYNLQSITDRIDALRTISDYTLGDVLTATGAVRGSGNPDIAAVLTAIAALPQSPADIASVLSAISNLDGDVAALKTVADGIVVTQSAHTSSLAGLTSTLGTVASGVAAIPDLISAGTGTISGLLSTLSTLVTDKAALVLAAIQAVADAIAALAGAGDTAPIWPGVAGVTKGEAVAIVDDTEVAGPMDGVIIDLTTVPPGKGFWTVATHNAYKYAGYVAFVSDDGDADEQQYLGFDEAVYVPKRLKRAASCLIHCAPGIEGTATPWDVA